MWKIIFISFLLLMISDPVFAVDFLVPGVSLASISFEQGAMVQYLLISETFEVRDSSYVEIEILDCGREEVHVMITNSSYPPREDETVSVRLVFTREIKDISSPDQYVGYIKAVHIKDGNNPFREATEEEAADFDFEKLFHDSDGFIEEDSLGYSEIVTPAGSFICSGNEYTYGSSQKINLGGVEGKREEIEISRFWRTDKVPFWGIVRSKVEKRSSTSIPAGAIFRNPKVKVTVTESILLDFRRAAKDR